MSVPPPTAIAPSATAEPANALPVGALLLGLAGGALLLSRRRFPPYARTAATIAGLALLGAAARRPVVGAVRRAGTRRRSAEVRLSIVIQQPVERVFGFCRDFENFPRVIRALQEVRDYGDGRSHWCAATPGGNTHEWDTIVTKYVPNSVIGWQTVGSSTVRSTGLIRVKPERGGTCMSVAISYAVTDTRMVDALIALSRPPRGRQLEEDIRRIAGYLETSVDAVPVVPVVAATSMA